MKKSHIILAAVPVVCALGGFGAGQLFKGDAPTAELHQTAAPRTAAEAVLHTLAGDVSGEDAGHALPAQDGHDTPAAHDTPAQQEQHSALIHGARIMPASFSQADGQPAEDHPRIEAAPAMDHAAEPALSPSEDPVNAHRLDPAKLAQHNKEVLAEKYKAERARELAEKMAKIEASVDKSARHPALLPVDVEAQITEDAIKRVAASEDHVVRLGRITLPVEGPAKTTYYVADFGVSVTDMDQASYYYEGSNAARLRDQVMQTLHALGPTQMLRPDRVDSEKLAERVSQDLRNKFAGVEDFLFLSLYKTDVPRS